MTSDKCLGIKMEKDVGAKMEEEEEAFELVVKMEEDEILSMADLCSDCLEPHPEPEDDRAVQKKRRVTKSEVAESQAETTSELDEESQAQPCESDDEIIMPAMDWGKYNNLAMTMAAQLQMDLAPACQCVWKLNIGCDLPTRCKKLDKLKGRLKRSSVRLKRPSEAFV